MENPVKTDDLGVPLFSETSKCWQFDAPFFVRALNTSVHIMRSYSLRIVHTCYAYDQDGILEF